MTQPKPETKNDGKKLNLAAVFREGKDVLCCLQETPRKTEKDVWLH